MRLFIAVLFPDAVVDKLSEWRDRIHDESSSGSFVQRDNLHLTLNFLGECSSREEKLAEEAVASIKMEPFSLKMDRIGFFSRPDGDIWWVGVEENKSLQDLQRSLSSSLAERGFKLEKRKFRPHITLGRRVITTSGTGHIEPIVSEVDSIALMLSERGDGRMIYTPLFLNRLSGSMKQ